MTPRPHAVIGLDARRTFRLREVCQIDVFRRYLRQARHFRCNLPSQKHDTASIRRLGCSWCSFRHATSKPPLTSTHSRIQPLVRAQVVADSGSNAGAALLARSHKTGTSLCSSFLRSAVTGQDVGHRWYERGALRRLACYRIALG